MSGDEQKLASAGLPVLRDAGEIAAAMEISIGELRFLAFNRRTSVTTHYKRFTIAKKTGGRRTISAPISLQGRTASARPWLATWPGMPQTTLVL